MLGTRAVVDELGSLRALARLHGLQLSYTDAAGRRRRASTEALVAALRALGAPLARPGDAPAALRERRARLAAAGLEPVVVVWEGGRVRTVARLPGRAAGRLRARVELEDGGVASCAVEPLRSRAGGLAAAAIELPAGLPDGYHRLVAEAGAWERQALVVSAPASAHEPPGERRRGVYAPLYAVRSARSWGAGSLSDLVRLGEWVAAAGGDAVAVLPLLAAHHDGSWESSPYAPSSRRLWNELYVDLERAAALDPSGGAAAAAAALAPALAEARRARRVDYERLAALRRPVLEALADAVTAVPEHERALRTFLAGTPLAAEYARFRAAAARHGSAWRRWPAGTGPGELGDRHGPERERRYHAVAQWLANGQAAQAAAALRGRGVALYLDLPLGVHPDGFDAWRERHLFLSGATAGAPPDDFFRLGQDWGLAPVDPEASRAEGHRYFRECLVHHLRAADGLRIDHVMGLHRLYLVPEGLAAADGVYVRCPAEELYAIVCLESRRARARVVGEDLGTVPAAVRAAMRRRRLARTHVLQLAVRPGRRPALAPVPRGSLASLNTHDMPTFAAFWAAEDVDDRVALGLLDAAGAAAERAERAGVRSALAAALRERGFLRAGRGKVESVLAAALAYLGSSEAGIALVNLEDLWLETAPQNTPGTTAERPNWRRLARLSLEELQRAPAPGARLRSLATGSSDDAG